MLVRRSDEASAIAKMQDGLTGRAMADFRVTAEELRGWVIVSSLELVNIIQNSGRDAYREYGQLPIALCRVPLGT